MASPLASFVGYELTASSPAKLAGEYRSAACRDSATMVLSKK